MSRQFRSPFALIAVIVAATLALAGCSSDEPIAVDETSSPSIYDPPTLAQITSAVSLDEDQTAVVTAALEQWQSEARSENQRRFRGAIDNADVEHPLGDRGYIWEFVADVAPSMDAAKLGEIVTFLAAHRAERVEQLRERFAERRHGPRGGHGGHGFAEELGLTDEQIAALEAARNEMRAAMKALHDQFINDEITEDEFIEQAKALRDAMHEKLEEILTEEQLAKLEALREERMKAHIERRLETLGDDIDKRVDRLTRILELTDAQQVQLTSILEAAVPDIRAVLEALLNGDIDKDAAMDQLREIRSDTRAAIEAILTEEQLAKLEALHPIMARRHGMK